MYVLSLCIMTAPPSDGLQEADLGRWHPHAEGLHWDDVGSPSMPSAYKSSHCSPSIYYVFFITIMRIPPEKLQRPFIVSSIMFGGT